MKYLKFILIIVLSFIFIPNVYAADEVTIKSIQLDTKASNTEVITDPIIDGLSMKFDVKFFTEGDYIKYKVVIDNQTDNDYEIGVPNNSSEYITYEYLFDNGPILKKNSETIMYVLIKYNHIVPDSQLVSNSYTETSNVVINIGKDEIVKNPDTSDKSSILPFIILFTVFISILLYKKYGIKNVKYIMLLALILFPVSIYALTKLELKVESKVTVENITCTDLESDSWDTILLNIKKNNTSCYHIGDTKNVAVNNYGTYKVRLVNNTTPEICSSEGFSQTACGYVFEFSQVITTTKMTTVAFYNTKGGWPDSTGRRFLNETIYEALPEDLKNAIIDTYTVSGHGNFTNETNYVSNDKLYFLSPKELWNYQNLEKDTDADLTRQLDYYEQNGVLSVNGDYCYNCNFAVKTDIGYWNWLRTAYGTSTESFFIDYHSGAPNGTTYSKQMWIAPVFRLG